jgi:hypothetical protein
MEKKEHKMQCDCPCHKPDMFVKHVEPCCDKTLEKFDEPEKIFEDQERLFEPEDLEALD